MQIWIHNGSLQPWTINFNTVELCSKKFQGTGLIFPIDWNSLTANIEINKKIALYSMIHLTCNITNLYCSVRWHDRELCNSLFERVFICIYAIPHLYTYLWCQFHHFHIQNEVSHATNLPRKFSFQKVRGDLDCKEEHSQVAKLDPIGFC